MVAEPERAEQITRTRAHFFRRQPPQRAHRQHDIVEHGEFGQQEMKLEYKAEHCQPCQRALFFVHMRCGTAANQHLAARRQIEQPQQIK